MGRTLEIGRTLGHYRLLERIGAGGMGEVWRARDERLERDVALKVLLPGTIANEAARKRFRREALALSKLNHPGIATIFDFDSEDGHDFLVMEYVSGMTLGAHHGEGVLPEMEVVRLGLQLAEGLAAAHAEGIIHRDLKPANVRLTADGRLKILDFGLAHLAQAAGSLEPTRSQSMTEPGVLLGTLSYMAPEQVRGEKVDARTDLWAAGLVLYELATGKPGYGDRETAPLLHAILNDPLVAPRKANPLLSTALEAILLKCVEKDPAKRYAAARELAEDLQRLRGGLSVAAERARTHTRRMRRLALAGPVAVVLVLVALTALDVGGLRTRLFAPAPIRSIAVLPLANLSGDPAQEYFADGMTEQLINDLGQVGSLRIISRTSTMQYKGTKKGLKAIARELGVDGIVEGSVVRSGDRVRITAQLIRANEDRQLWADTFERELRDVLVMQGEIAQAIVGQVRAKLTADQATRLADARQVNPEAQEAYLKARYYWNLMTDESTRQAIAYAKKAVAIDPDFGPGHMVLAQAYAQMGTLGFDFAAPKEYLPKAKAEALKALALDPGCVDAYDALYNVFIGYEYDLQAADSLLDRALAMHPNSALLLVDREQLCLVLGRYDEAIQAITRAVDLDPLEPFVRANLVGTYVFARKYDRAVAVAEEVLRRDPNFWITHWTLGSAFEGLGRFDDAIREHERAIALSGGNLNPKSSLGHAYAVAGRRSDALRVLREFDELAKTRFVPAHCRAPVYAGLGDWDQAFLWLDRALEERSGVISWLPTDPTYDSVRSDPRYRALMSHVRFPSG